MAQELLYPIPMVSKTNKQELRKEVPTVISIVDWFDAKNLAHLQAYQTMQNTGYWPEHFIPADVAFPICWNTMLRSKITDIYVEETIRRLTGTALRTISAEHGRL